MKFSTPRFSWSLMLKLEMQKYRGGSNSADQNLNCNYKFV